MKAESAEEAEKWVLAVREVRSHEDKAIARSEATTTRSEATS